MRGRNLGTLGAAHLAPDGHRTAARGLVQRLVTGARCCPAGGLRLWAAAGRTPATRRCDPVRHRPPPPTSLGPARKSVPRLRPAWALWLAKECRVLSALEGQGLVLGRTVVEPGEHSG